MRELKDAKCGASLEAGILTLENGHTFPVAALVDLLESIEDTGDSSDDGESFTVMGNVSKETLEAVGLRPVKLAPLRKVTYSPWLLGYDQVGLCCTDQDGKEIFIYLNPSSDDSDGGPNVFVYRGPHGNPILDEAVMHIFSSEVREGNG